MFSSLFHTLSQMDYDKYIKGTGTVEFSGEYSYVFTWLIGGVLAIGILLITFKTSRRNHLEKD